jgi:NitT/TauT family transport system substrate-binding protein
VSAQDLTPVRLQLTWLPNAQFAGYHVAKEKGFFEDEGLDVTIIPGGTNVVPLQQLAGGAADFSITSRHSLFVARDEGLPIIAIGAQDVKDVQTLVARSSLGLTGPGDLKGKKVGVWFGNGENLEFEALMRKLGIDPQTDVTLVSQSFTMDQFLNEEIDAASCFIMDECLVLKASGFADDDLFFIDYDEEGVGVPHDDLVTTEAYLAENRDVAQRLLRAAKRGWEYALDHQDEAVDAILAQQPVDSYYTRETLTDGMAVMPGIVESNGRDQILRITPDSMDRVATMVTDSGLVEEPADASAAYDATVWDEAFAQ